MKKKYVIYGGIQEEYLSVVYASGQAELERVMRNLYKFITNHKYTGVIFEQQNHALVIETPYYHMIAYQDTF